MSHPQGSNGPQVDPAHDRIASIRSGQDMSLEMLDKNPHK